MSGDGWWAGRRVLLTGHTGFKGAWLGLWLHRLRARVTGFAGPPPTEPSLFALAHLDELLDDRRGDVRDAAAVRAAAAACGPEVVFHLAAQPLVRRGLADPAGTYATNVSGTAHLLDAVRAEAPEAAVVVVTSDKCYAAPGARRCREDDPLGGRDPYSSSKAAQELVAAAYRDSLGLRIATARAGNVIGGGDWAEDRLVPDLVRAAFARRPLRLRDPDAVRPWQHVLNPLSGYLELARRLTGSAASARAFNFGPAAEDERPVRWVVERLAARWPGGVDVGLDARDSAAVEAHALRLDSSRAREALGWAPRWRLAEALEAVVEWHAEVALGADARAVTLAQLERFALPRSAASLQRR